MSLMASISDPSLFIFGRQDRYKMEYLYMVYMYDDRDEHDGSTDQFGWATNGRQQRYRQLSRIVCSKSVRG